MNKSDLINDLKYEADLSRSDAEIVVESFFDSVAETLSGGERVEIRGFGSFTVKDYKAYVGRNPKNGVQIEVPSKKLPFFKVGKELKERVDTDQ
ncbi:HU family DNA-binding protein [Thermodesulfobacteriota bacterium]